MRQISGYPSVVALLELLSAMLGLGISTHLANVGNVMSRVKMVGLSIRSDLLSRLDAIRGDVPRSRFICRLVESGLQERAGAVRQAPATVESHPHQEEDST